LFLINYLILQCVSEAWTILTLSWWFGFWLKLILGNGRSTLKAAYVKSDLKIIISSTSFKIPAILDIFSIFHRSFEVVSWQKKNTFVLNCNVNLFVALFRVDLDISVFLYNISNENWLWNVNVMFLCWNKILKLHLLYLNICCYALWGNKWGMFLNKFPILGLTLTLSLFVTFYILDKTNPALLLFIAINIKYLKQPLCPGFFIRFNTSNFRNYLCFENIVLWAVSQSFITELAALVSAYHVNMCLLYFTEFWN